MLLSRLVCATGIIFPLYIYPGDGCAAWTSLINSITTHTTMHFTLIVNPDSGPGASPTPDSNYQACIPMLRPSTNPNVKLVGYVRTNYTNRAQADVEADTNTYNNWAASYSMDGIFFDEVNGTSDHLATYTTYANHARSLTWHSSSFVVLNPGASILSGYFGIADEIVTYENFYDSFTTSSLVLDDTTQPPSKQAVILHTAPSTAPASTINTLKSDGLRDIYITDIKDDASTNFNPYGALPTDWTTFVSDVQC